MRVIITIAALLVCTMANVAAFAQSTNVTSENARVQDKVASQKANDTRYNSLKSSGSEKGSNADMETSDVPYHNYNGIQDNTEAKKAWVKDHPEKYAALQGKKLPPYYNYKGIEDIDKAKKAWVVDHPKEFEKR